SAGIPARLDLRTPQRLPEPPDGPLAARARRTPAMRQPDARSAKDVHGRHGHVILMDVDHTVFRLPLHKRVLTVIGVAVFAIGCIAAACASYALAGGIVTVSVFMALAVAMAYRMFGVSVTVQGEE